MKLEKNPTWLCVVAAALSDGAGRWLMHLRPAHKQHGRMWEFPGGKVEPREIPRNALVREIAEELGIELEQASLIPAAFAEDSKIVILLYTATGWSGEPCALDAGAQIGWFEPAEIEALPRPPLDIALCAQLFGAQQG